MDKTTWFVVTLCVGLLGLNFWYNSEQQANTPPAQPAAQVAPAASPATAATSPASQPAAPVAATRQPQIIATITSRDEAGAPVARYNFQDVGGSVRCVDMLGKAINSTRPELSQDVSINGSAAQGIGTLMFGLSDTQAPAYDQSVYQIVPEQTNDTQVTLVARVGDLIVRKIYALKPLKVNRDGEETTVAGNAYVLKLKVDIQNTADHSLAANNWGIFAGGMSQISLTHAVSKAQKAQDTFASNSYKFIHF